MNISYRRRASAGLAALVLLPLAAIVRPARAQAQAPVQLFKLISPKDEIVVGIEAAQLGAGQGPGVQRLAELLVAKGQLTLWQYASQKDAGGALVQAPLRQVAVFKNELLRIEPYTTPLAIKAPAAAK
ncbi:hypothetical protein QFZ42_005300 [Variovorax paradoxus]|jgi:hypothetical protein|uniref:hypothetical protein n=1 Tax=Variovorax paradoxus TaxID=34073 RepID=UPI00278D3FDE|nr:hypothetical protein [Variovorax paradoxus]MDQ0573466.1 hypothetical protein [Variovorax paradoxus]